MIHNRHTRIIVTFRSVLHHGHCDNVVDYEVEKKHFLANGFTSIARTAVTLSVHWYKTAKSNRKKKATDMTVLI